MGDEKVSGITSAGVVGGEGKWKGMGRGIKGCLSPPQVTIDQNLYVC